MLARIFAFILVLFLLIQWGRVPRKWYWAAALAVPLWLIFLLIVGLIWWAREIRNISKLLWEQS